MNFIPWAKPHLSNSDKKRLINSFDSNWISGGDYINKFEKKLSIYLNSKSVLSVNNGTSAILLIYQALNLKSGDEIILPGFGYMAAANLALQLGIKPVFVDIDEDTFCIDVKKIKNKITKKTKLIVAINTYGNICDFNDLNLLKKNYNFFILEDAAESLGSTTNGKQSGTNTDFGTFSFQATKTITTGEGGLITVRNSSKLLKKLKLLRSHGVEKKKYYHVLPGGNFRLTNLQASIGFSQLIRINEIKEKRRKIYFFYRELLKHQKNIRFQIFNKGIDPMYWTLPIYLNNKKKIKRDIIIKKLLKKKIETRNGFYSPNKMKIYKNFYDKSLRVSDKLSDYIICLPIYYDLNQSQIEYIVKEFNEIIN